MAEPIWEGEAPQRGNRLPLVVLGLLAAVAAGLLLQGPAEDAALPVIDEPALPGVAPDAAPTVEPAEDTDALPSGIVHPAERWRRLPAAPLSGTGPAVSDGRRVIVWPGAGSTGVYDLELDVWGALPAAPITRTAGWSASWSGEEVLVWGGTSPDDDDDRTGAAFDPLAMRWRAIPAAPIAGRTGHAAAWGAGRLWIWGGRATADGALLADGAAYDPVTRTWEALPAAPLGARHLATAVHTGAGLLVWGGRDGDDAGPSLTDGALLDLPTGTWRSITAAPVAFMGSPAAVWAGSRLLVWGRPHAGLHLRDGYAWDPSADTWEELPDLLSQVRFDAEGGWSGDVAAVWGGVDWRGQPRRLDGFAFHPATRRWAQIPALPTDPGTDASAVVVRDELVVVGSAGGARYALPRTLIDDPDAQERDGPIGRGGRVTR